MTRALISLRYRLARNDDGATAVEYGLLVALIAAVIVGIVATLGGQINNRFHERQHRPRCGLSPTGAAAPIPRGRRATAIPNRPIRIGIAMHRRHRAHRRSGVVANEGATAVEYSLLLACIAGVIVTVVATLGTTVAGLFSVPGI